jgi:tRNA(fMet)-specific endonuclease VapC
MRFLLDSNILSEPVKPQPNANVMAALAEHIGEYCTSVTVWHELIYGIELLDKSKKKDGLKAYIESLEHGGLRVLPYEEPAARWLAKERARFSRAGKAIALADGEIASISATNQLTLITRNIQDFNHFNGLMIENWFD